MKAVRIELACCCSCCQFEATLDRLFKGLDDYFDHADYHERCLILTSENADQLLEVLKSRGYEHVTLTDTEQEP